MTKLAIRILYKQKRRKLTIKEKDRLENLILIQFKQLQIFENFSIMSYSPIKVQNEYDPYLVECFCMFKNRSAKFCFPIVDRSNDTMNAYMVHVDSTFEKNEYGISEPIGGIKILPKDIQIIFVPLIAFSKDGHRVGYGKGYYDKFLKTCSPNVIKIGFSFFDVVTIDDIGTLDEKLDYCITPEHIYQF